jgi:hypothetical protein
LGTSKTGDDIGFKRGEWEETEQMRIYVFLGGNITAVTLLLLALAVNQEEHAKYNGRKNRKILRPTSMYCICTTVSG